MDFLNPGAGPSRSAREGKPHRVRRADRAPGPGRAGEGLAWRL